MSLDFNNIIDYLYQQKRFIVIFFIVFFVVGFFGIILPVSHHLFMKLFPVALLLSFFAILLFHQAPYDVKTVIALVLIGISGYFIEVAGVNTHLIFGNYNYGNSLGTQLFNTPLLIGINWVILTFASCSITEKLSIPVSLKIISAALVMLLYDVILEHIAPDLNMWYWAGNVVPYQNFLAWFLIAVIFQSFIKMMGIMTRNHIASTILLCQALFFLSLILYFRFAP
jgi:putative membrane protein